MSKTNVIILGSKKFIKNASDICKSEGKNVNSTTEPSLFKSLVDKSDETITEYIIEESKIERPKGLFSKLTSLFSGPTLELDFIEKSNKLSDINTKEIENFSQLSNNQNNIIKETPADTPVAKQSLKTIEPEAETPAETPDEDDDDFNLEELIASTSIEESPAETEDDDEDFDIEALLKAAESGELPIEEQQEEDDEHEEGLDELLTEQPTEEGLDELLTEQPIEEGLDEQQEQPIEEGLDELLTEQPIEEGLDEQQEQEEVVEKELITQNYDNSEQFKKIEEDINSIKSEVSSGLEELKNLLENNNLQQIDSNIDLSNTTNVFADLNNLNELFGKLVKGDAIVFQLKSKISNVIKEESKIIEKESGFDIDADSILNEIENKINTRVHSGDNTKEGLDKELNLEEKNQESFIQNENLIDDFKKLVPDETHSERRRRKELEKEEEKELVSDSLNDILNQTADSHKPRKKATSISNTEEVNKIDFGELSSIMNQKTVKKTKSTDTNKINVEDMLKEILGD